MNHIRSHERTGADHHSGRTDASNGFGEKVETRCELLDDTRKVDYKEISGGGFAVWSSFRSELGIQLFEEGLSDPDLAAWNHEGSELSNPYWETMR